MGEIFDSFEVPVRDRMLRADGFVDTVWGWFFRSITDRVYPLGQERVFTLVNNQASAADITGLKFNYKKVSHAVIDFCVQRVTTSTGAVELTEAGILHAVYQPTSASWAIHEMTASGPDDSGITFTITAAGQVQYTTTNITGTAYLSRIFWRARTLAGKTSLYSQLGAR